jgi:hypothetical protein
MVHRAMFTIITLLQVALGLCAQDTDPLRDTIPERMSYLDNGTLRIGVNLSIGGAITYLAESEKQINMINSHDWGRQIQMSFYSGPRPFVPDGAHVKEAWKGLGWNPIQSGDSYSFPSEILEHRNDGNSIYVRCIPKIWPLRNVPGECEFECWIRLEGHTAKIRSRLVNSREDHTQYMPGRQELPAVYTNGPWYKLVSYLGDKPFSGEAPTVLVDKGDGKGWPWRTWYTPEYWTALVDEDNHGLGIFEPGVGFYSGGFAARPDVDGHDKGSGGSKDFATGHMTPRVRDIIDHNIDYSYEYTLIVGSLKEIRSYVYEQERPVKVPHWDFESDRQHWRYTNTTDAGWPIKGSLEVHMGASDARMIGPQVLWKAEDAPKLYLETAFRTQAKEITISIQPFEEADRQDWEQWGENQRPERQQGIEVTVPIEGDGQTRLLEVDLSSVKAYKGPMTQLQILLPSEEGLATIFSIGFKEPLH